MIGSKELLEEFEDFLRAQEGDISAITIAECWNLLAKKHKWNDNLVVINKFTKKRIRD